MQSKKGFVFSVDAFVAFSLSLVALYSLVFFSAIPQTYYPALMQAHNLAQDTLSTLSNTPGPDISGSGSETALGYIVYADPDQADEYLDVLIPQEFGYILERQVGDQWETITSTVNEPEHQYYRKLKAVSYAVVNDYGNVAPDNENPFGYQTCNGSRRPCNLDSTYEAGDYRIGLVRLTIYV